MIPVIAVFAILLFIAPVGIWNRLIKIHADNKKAAERTHALLERIANALEGRISKPPQPPTRTPGKYSRS